MRNLIQKVSAIVGIALILCSAGIAASGSGPNKEDNRKIAVEARNDNFNRAKSLYPDPRPKNYPMRKQLVDFTNREDAMNHPWYVYILGDNGNVVGYYVAKFAPENSCNFLSSTEDIYSNSEGLAKMQAPSYDGVYYAESICDEWFFFDAATNALIKIRGTKFYTADQPLRIDAKPIRVAK